MNKVCLNCQKTLIRTQRKFCSDKCFKTPRKKNCKNCKKLFIGGHQNSFCCHKCREFYRKSNPVKNGVPAKYLKIKNCNKCKIDKNYKDYRKINALKTGPRKGQYIGWTDIDGNKRFSICTICENSGFMKRYRKNPYHQLFHNFKKRASFAKVPFELSKEDMREIFENSGETCPVFKFKYVKDANKNNRDYAPSLDRIDPKKGYTKENTIVVSMLANRIKTDASIEQIGKVYKFYKMLLKNKIIN